MGDNVHFQARDHGDGTLELIGILPGMNAGHPAIGALLLLSRKFKNVIFTLQESASLEPDAFGKLIEATSAATLKVVTSLPDAHPFEKVGIRTFTTVEDAIRAIKGDKFASLVLQKMDSIPELHADAFELLQKLNAPDCDFKKLAGEILQEQALASQILKTSNSAFFMRRAKVDTLSGALTVLGLDGVKQILVFNVFKGVTKVFEVQKEVRDHGRNCALIAAYLADLAKMPRQVIGKIKLAGLLHDIGRLALVFYFQKEYEEVRRLIKTEGKRSFEAEIQVFGIEHQRLGRMLADKWGFPDYLSQVIGDHHDLRAGEWATYTSPVMCANGFLNHCIEEIPYTPYYQKLQGYFAHLGQDKLSLTALQEKLKGELERLAAEQPTDDS